MVRVPHRDGEGNTEGAQVDSTAVPKASPASLGHMFAVGAGASSSSSQHAVGWCDTAHLTILHQDKECACVSTPLHARLQPVSPSCRRQRCAIQKAAPATTATVADAAAAAAGAVRGCARLLTSCTAGAVGDPARALTHDPLCRKYPAASLQLPGLTLLRLANSSACGSSPQLPAALGVDVLDMQVESLITNEVKCHSQPIPSGGHLWREAHTQVGGWS